MKRIYGITKKETNIREKYHYLSVDYLKVMGNGGEGGKQINFSQMPLREMPNLTVFQIFDYF